MKRFMICYFATVFSMLLFAISLSFSWIILAVVGILLFAGCLVWFAKLMEKSESYSYRQIRRHSDKLNDIEKELRIMQFEIRGKADADVDISVLATNNVRPGSKPSITYANMKAIEEGKNDVRNEIKEPAV